MAGDRDSVTIEHL